MCPKTYLKCKKLYPTKWDVLFLWYVFPITALQQLRHNLVSEVSLHRCSFLPKGAAATRASSREWQH